jgi:hypothetical protein
VSRDVYRDGSLVELGTYYASGETSAALVQALKEKWALLRERNHAADSPVEILVAANGGGDHVKVVELFRWRSQDDRAEAAVDGRCRKLQSWIEALAPYEPVRERFTRAVPGVDRNFLPNGATELLKAAWSCTLRLDSEPEDRSLRVGDGVLLLHRSHGADLDGDGLNEMYFEILMHAGEADVDGFGRFRVSQNVDVPGDGIVKSNGEERDFPGTAIWRAGWKLQTPLGELVTDPQAPLVFGPSIVAHHPPVGVHFESAAGAVALLDTSSRRQVGTLSPGELTVAELVVTKDDEVRAEYRDRAGGVLEVLDRSRKLAAIPY